ncbi:acyl-CoA N-acyltransferase [Mycena crocata]|nr:acyl-CoA N-acyltransferase [Mycena crocata]
MGDLIFKNVPFEDLLEAIDIEMQGFPPDEAATIEAFQLRQTLATDLFLGAYRITDGGEQLVGYICSTLAEGSSLTHDSMSTHVPDALSVCIHSVCVSSTWQRQGVGLKLLREYIARLETVNRERFVPYRRVLLITHEILRHFYEMAGFEWVGPSTVHHGPEPWYEMRLTLGLTPTSSDPAHIRGAFDALQRSSDNNLVPRLLSSIPGGIPEVSSNDTNVSVNKFDILCPRKGCGSVILKSGVARLREKTSLQMEPAQRPHNPLLPILPPPPAVIQWWLITPSPMEFKNIGFSHAIFSLGDKIQLLACAECDLGPLGWCKEGGAEFWLACSRVGYQT